MLYIRCRLIFEFFLKSYYNVNRWVKRIKKFVDIVNYEIFDIVNY